MIETLARQCILNRKDYIPGKPVEEVQRELGLTDVLKMASNENPLGPSPLALKAMHSELENNASLYPESLCIQLAEKLATNHGIDLGQLFIDNGADGVITMIGLTFINPQDEVIFGELTFPAYENITTKMDGICVTVPMTEDNRLDLDGFVQAITPQTKMMFVCNPNNPSGTINTREEIEQLLASVPSNVLVVLDEAYYDFADRPDFPHSLSYLKGHPNLIILRTFSKIMGLAGVRIGYAIASTEIVKVMLKAREPFPVNRIAQAGALASLEDKEFVAKTITLNAAGREQYYKAFDEMGLLYYKSQTNFVYVELGKPAADVFENMLRDGVIVRPLTSQGRPFAMRISIGTFEQNEQTITSLKKAMSK